MSNSIPKIPGTDFYEVSSTSQSMGFSGFQTYKNRRLGVATIVPGRDSAQELTDRLYTLQSHAREVALILSDIRRLPPNHGDVKKGTRELHKRLSQYAQPRYFDFIFGRLAEFKEENPKIFGAIASSVLSLDENVDTPSTIVYIDDIKYHGITGIVGDTTSHERSSNELDKLHALIEVEFGNISQYLSIKESLTVDGRIRTAFEIKPAELVGITRATE